MATTPVKLWDHPNPSSTNVERFRKQANEKFGLDLKTYHDLWEWSTSSLDEFWMHVWAFTRVKAQVEPTYAIKPTEFTRMMPRGSWFPEARLNFAQNILETPFRRPYSHEPVLTGMREGGEQTQHWTIFQLREKVGRLANALSGAGVVQGDRVACIGANSVDTYVVFMAAAAIGAIFTSCSPETGQKGILDRLAQVQPKALFADDGFVYNGKRGTCLAKIISISRILEAQANLKLTVIIPRFSDSTSTPLEQDRLCWMHDFVKNMSTHVTYVGLQFDDPLVIVYSSGTTGQPKCIVHSIGGVLLKQKIEQILCTDMGSDSVRLQYTTTNWIMYLYAVSGLLSGARSILYDGSPAKPSMPAFMDILTKESVTHFGTSAHYLLLLQGSGFQQSPRPDLGHLKVVTSTGSVLMESQYYWVYKTFGQVQLSSIAGGTDIAGAFVGGTPTLAVYAGWCQARTLGMKVQIFSRDGVPIETTGEPGELVCTATFPSQPIFFWNDPGSKRYKSAYFEQFDGIWTQGDFIRLDPGTGGVQFMGRSDGVLNPSGVRFGSAEIYNCLSVFPEIENPLCVGQRRPSDTDERVLLFVKMKPGHQFSNTLRTAIATRIRTELSARHVPAYCSDTPDIPMTVNGKKTEVPVKLIVSGQKVVPSSTIVNPESLKWYEQFARLEHHIAPSNGNSKL